MHAPGFVLQRLVASCYKPKPSVHLVTHGCEHCEEHGCEYSEEYGEEHGWESYGCESYHYGCEEHIPYVDYDDYSPKKHKCKKCKKYHRTNNHNKNNYYRYSHNWSNRKQKIKDYYIR